MFMCEKAVEKDISGICVTDHCELRTWAQEKYELRIRQSVFEAAKARRVFNGKLAVMAGVELGDVLYDPALTDKVLASFKFDMVMVSQHNTVQGEDIYSLRLRRLEPRAHSTATSTGTSATCSTWRSWTSSTCSAT